MSLCVECGYPTFEPEGLCAHHGIGYGDNWAMANRIMCDFLHRGIVSARPSELRFGRPAAARRT
jgi:hypothetical protein